MSRWNPIWTLGSMEVQRWTVECMICMQRVCPWHLQLKETSDAGKIYPLAVLVNKTEQDSVIGKPEIFQRFIHTFVTQYSMPCSWTHELSHPHPTPQKKYKSFVMMSNIWSMVSFARMQIISDEMSMHKSTNFPNRSTEMAVWLIAFCTVRYPPASSSPQAPFYFEMQSCNCSIPRFSSLLLLQKRERERPHGSKTRRGERKQLL